VRGPGGSRGPVKHVITAPSRAGQPRTSERFGIAHANLAGCAPRGGVLLWRGIQPALHRLHLAPSGAGPPGLTHLPLRAATRREASAGRHQRERAVEVYAFTALSVFYGLVLP
jgi:hypothetical protein